MEYEKRKHFIVNIIYGALIILIVTLVLRYGLGMIAPFLAAFLIAALLKALAGWLCRKLKLPYKPVALILVLLFYSTVGLLISLLVIELGSATVKLVSRLPSLYAAEIEPALRAFFNGVEYSVSQITPDIVTTLSDLFSQFVKSVGELVTNISVKIVSAVSGYATSLPGLLIRILLMIISTFFIAADYDKLTAFVSRQLSDKLRKLLLEVKEYVLGTLLVCIRSYALIMAITFFELSIGLAIVGVHRAVLVALCIAIFDILPVFGTGGIMIPWIIISVFQGNYPLAVGLLAVYVVITVIRNIIEPKIVGSQLGLHPIVTLVSMFIGAQLFGVIGLFGLPIFLSLLRHLNDNGTIHLFK